MESPFGFMLWIILSVILLIPFGMALMYFLISIRQLLIGAREESSVKQKGGIVAFIISFLVMGAILIFWLWVGYGWI